MPFPFPYSEYGLSESDFEKYINISYALPFCLYLDTSLISRNYFRCKDAYICCKHHVIPKGRCGSPIELTGAEIKNDDRGNFTYTDISIIIPYLGNRHINDYLELALEITNLLINSYRLAFNRPTLSTLSFSDLSHGVEITVPYRIEKSDLESSGLAGMFVGGNKEGKPISTIKGFVGGYQSYVSIKSESDITILQEYLDKKHTITTSLLFQMSAEKELKHGDFKFAAVLGASCADIATDSFLNRKNWQEGPKHHTFAERRLEDPFIANNVTSFRQAYPTEFTYLELLYKIRNKVVHEGEAYYIDNSYSPPQCITVFSNEIANYLTALKVLIPWLESI
jgi:hypothetical protein